MPLTFTRLGNLLYCTVLLRALTVVLAVVALRSLTSTASRLQLCQHQLMKWCNFSQVLTGCCVCMYVSVQAFQARTARAPEQCVRYCFQPGAAPLWPSHTHRPAAGAVPACQHCGAERQFEVQVRNWSGPCLSVWLHKCWGVYAFSFGSGLYCGCCGWSCMLARDGCCILHFDLNTPCGQVIHTP